MPFSVAQAPVALLSSYLRGMGVLGSAAGRSLSFLMLPSTAFNPCGLCYSITKLYPINLVTYCFDVSKLTPRLLYIMHLDHQQSNNRSRQQQLLQPEAACLQQRWDTVYRHLTTSLLFKTTLFPPIFKHQTNQTDTEITSGSLTKQFINQELQEDFDV